MKHRPKVKIDVRCFLIFMIEVLILVVKMDSVCLFFPYDRVTDSLKNYFKVQPWRPFFEIKNIEPGAIYYI